jgi:hypothetical protein
LVQLAENTAKQAEEANIMCCRLADSLLAAKALAEVDGHTKEKAEEITAAFLNDARDEILGGMKAPFAMHGMKASGPPASVHKEVQVNMRTRSGSVDQSVDQWRKALPRRSRGQTQATRGVNDRPQEQLACPVLLPVC